MKRIPLRFLPPSHHSRGIKDWELGHPIDMEKMVASLKDPVHLSATAAALSVLSALLTFLFSRRRSARDRRRVSGSTNQILMSVLTID